MKLNIFDNFLKLFWNSTGIIVGGNKIHCGLIQLSPEVYRHISFGKSVQVYFVHIRSNFETIRHIYFSFNLLYPHSSVSKGCIHQGDCFFQQSGRFQKLMKLLLYQLLIGQLSSLGVNWECIYGCKGPTFRVSAFLPLIALENPSNWAKTSEKNVEPSQVWFLLGSNFQTTEGNTSICTNSCTEI